VSVLFDAAGITIWWPSQTTAQVYVAYVRGLETAFGLSAGLDGITSDEVHVDVPAFRDFVEDIARRTPERGTNALLHGLFLSVLGPGVAMLERAGSDVEVSAEILEVARVAATRMPT
jgi:hypothetical protein